MEILDTACRNLRWNHCPLAVFFWLYHETKHKNETSLEISKNLDDPIKLERLLSYF